MCLGIPGEVVELAAGHPDLALVTVEGVSRAINVGLLRDGPDAPLDLAVGDWVLIHMGFALEKIDERVATASLGWVTGVDDAFGRG
ncbi:hydrogenase expression/formation protein HypC [Pseudonocardia thermophila]|jgi:hydrogenase assembly chaperone HypC/HupF|uniref:Hydrogenase expression/formation protein HypC n=1 Tax=Pseudonocardia thermophila TaxID=1848 RepID=A0A1M6Q035_PSETH|nr:HypC/HybG/HupF family hydrogenase formation chaperone [Pseudonocardia thermophila]SHK13512.1 hydrogenase expression/formation protein HypC [Pseudonocardia thermophila]